MAMLPAKAMVYLGLWYLASLVTLFINKHVLSNGINAQVLAVVQMTTTCVMGAAKVYSSRSPKKGKEDMFQSPLFFKRMFFVGIMRFSTVVLGLVSLKFVPVSFTETIKSSAPFFTVLFAWVILRESTSTLTKVALVPIAGGLALASATELEFHIIGFMAAVMNNCVDCIQNVYSKKLLSMMTFVELQFYTSLAAIIIQIPMWVGTSMYMGGVSLSKMNIRSEMIGWLAIDATSYHLQVGDRSSFAASGHVRCSWARTGDSHWGWVAWRSGGADKRRPTQIDAQVLLVVLVGVASFLTEDAWRRQKTNGVIT